MLLTYWTIELDSFGKIEDWRKRTSRLGNTTALQDTASWFPVGITELYKISTISVEKSVEILLPRLEKGLRFKDKYQIALEMGNFQLTEKTQFMCHIFISVIFLDRIFTNPVLTGLFHRKIFELLVGIGFCQILSFICLLIKASQILTQ